MVMGGESRDPRGAEFTDLNAMDIRGIYRTCGDALSIWRRAAQSTVNRNPTKYMIVGLR